MSFSKLLEKLLKNSGSGPETKDEIISKDITIQPWSATHNYPIGSLIRMGGGLICFAKQASGPDSPVGSQDPSLDSEHQYWSVVSTDDGNVVHKSGIEEITGIKVISDNYKYAPDRHNLEHSGFFIRMNGVDCQTYPSAHHFGGFVIVDENSTLLNYDGRIAEYGVCKSSSSGGGVYSYMSTYHPDQSSRDANVGCGLRLGYWNSDALLKSSARAFYLQTLRVPYDEYTDSTGGGIEFHDSTDTNLGGLWFHTYKNTSYSNIMVRRYILSIDNNSTWSDINNSTVMLVDYGSSSDKFFAPTPSGQIRLGTSNYKWKDVWAVSGTIQTSDSRLKTSIDSIPDSVLDAWHDIDFCQFQMIESVNKKGSDKARLHSGLIAQDINRVFSEHNIDVSRYGLFCHDSWKSEPEMKDQSGKILSPAIEAGDQYSLRYEEALCMEAAYNRREVKRLKERLARLEEQLAK